MVEAKRRRGGKIRGALTIIAAGALVAACSSGGNGKSSSTTAASGGKGGAVPTKLALEYTGGTAGKADAKLSAVKIGYINQETGSPSYPENTAGAELAVKYVNENLGGVKGHPVELVKCFVATEEDGQKCATQMLNDPSVKLVLTGTEVVGNDAIYSVLKDKKPIISGNGLTATDFAQPDAVTYMPASPGVVSGLAKWIVDGGVGKVKSVAVVATDDAGAKAAAQLLFQPAVEKAGISVKTVFISPTAQGSTVASAIKTAGGDKADVMVALVPVQSCIAIYDALKSLSINPTFVTSGLCFGTPLIKHLNGTFPNGWYFGAYGVNYFMPVKKGLLASEQLGDYMTVKDAYNPTMEYTGFAGPEFGNVLTITKFYNELGVDATSEQLRTTSKNFTGPQWGIPGPQACGKVSPLFVTVCSGTMGIEQFKDGKWISIADAYNNKLINAFS